MVWNITAQPKKVENATAHGKDARFFTAHLLLTAHARAEKPSMLWKWLQK